MIVYGVQVDYAPEGWAYCRTLRDARENAKAEAATGRHSLIQRCVVRISQATVIAALNRARFAESTEDIEEWEPIGEPGLMTHASAESPEYEWKIRRRPCRKERAA